MKFWLLALITVLACALTLAWLVRDKVIPRFLASANEEMVADWHAGMSEYRKENGAWPDTSDPKSFSEQIYVVRGADDRRIDGGYMHARPGKMVHGIVYDVFENPMRLSITGEKLHVASAGPNRKWGDADDVSSDKVKERYRPSTLAKARAEAEARAAKRNK